MDAMTDTSQYSCDCKIGQTMEKYGLDGLSNELVYKRNEKGASLRDLAEFINKRVLRTRLQQDVQLSDDLLSVLPGDDFVDTVYTTLTGDDVPSDKRARLRTRLSQQGLDLEELQDDWVTHPTVNKHLNECLNIETSKTATISLKDGISTIEWARTRAVGVTEQTINRLQSANRLSHDYEVSVQIRVSCSDCGQTYRHDELIQQGGCNCE